MKMRPALHLFALLAIAAGSSRAADVKAGQSVAPAEVFNGMLASEAREFIGAAEAMPADKFDFAPPASAGKFDGVRSFSAEIKHVTEGNYAIFRAFNLPGAKSRNEIEKLTDREQILAALRESFTYARTAVATLTPQNAFVALDAKGNTRAGAAAAVVAHPQDHYGQMVEYLRMNGIVPPASRK